MSFFDPSYLKLLQQYAKIIEQKNTLLRRNEVHLLGVWNEMLAKISLPIMEIRSHFVVLLNNYISLIFQQITGRFETLQLEYQPSFPKDKGNSVSELIHFLDQALSRESRYRCALVGPHRDDYQLFLNEYPDRDFFSQGSSELQICL